MESPVRSSPPNEPRPPGARSEAALLAEVRHCRRRLAWQGFLRRWLLLLAVAAAFPLLVVAADHAWPQGLPRPVVRLMARGWAAGLLGGALLLVAVSAWRRLNPLFAARFLERQAGIRHNALVNALLLRRAPAAQYACAAALAQAAVEVRTHAPARLSEPGALRMPAAVGLAVVLAWALYALVSPKPVWPSLARFFGADRPAPTATWLRQVQPEATQVVHAGEALRFVFAVGGRTVEEVRLELLDPQRPGEPPRARYRLHPEPGGPPGHWGVTLAPHEVAGDLRFRCVANDAVLMGVVPVQPEPAAEQVEIRLEPPTYTGWPVRTVTRPELDVLRGTRATFSVRANTLVRDGVFVLARGDGETRTRMTVDPADPRRLMLSMLLVEGGEYRIEFSDRWGYPLREAPRYPLTVRTDAPPEVRIVAPAPPETPEGVVDVTHWRALEVEAADDVALAWLAVVRDDAGVQERVTLAPAVSADGRLARIAVLTADFGLQPGQEVRVWFEARDNCTALNGQPAPQVGRSRTLTLVHPAERVRRPSGATRPAREGEPGRSGAEAAPAAETEPATAPAADARGDATAAPAEGEAPGGDATGGDFEEELRRFVRQHGDAAREVERRLRAAGAAAASQPAGESPAGAGGDGSKRDGASQAASRPVQGGAAQAEARPGKPESGAESGAADTASPPGETGRNLPETGPEQQAERPDDTRATSEPRSSGTRTPEETRRCEGEAASESESGASGGTRAGDSEGRDDGETSAGPPDGSSGGGSSGASDDADQTPEASGSASEGDAGDAEGGEGAAGTGSTRAEPVPEQAPEVDVAPPGGPARPDRNPAPGSAGLVETLDLLEMLERGRTIDEELLIDLGWPAERAAGFVRALERLHTLAQRSGYRGSVRRLRVDVRLGEERVLAGTGRGAALSAGLDRAQAQADGLGRITPPPEQAVPNHLRRLLDAYYRALAERQRDSEP